MGEGVREMLRVGKLDRVRPNARRQQALLKLCVIGCQRGPEKVGETEYRHRAWGRGLVDGAKANGLVGFDGGEVRKAARSCQML